MRLWGLAAACTLTFALFSASASAAPATLAVNNTADIGLEEHGELCGQGKGPLEGVCTLRAAMELASTFPGIGVQAGEVAVSVPPGVYTLGTHHPLPTGDVFHCLGPGETEVLCPLRLQGAGAASSVIDGAGATGLLKLQKGAGPVAVSGLTLRNSSSTGGAVEDREGPPLTIADSRLLENDAVSLSGGAAVQIVKSTVTIARSAIEGNSAGLGGAVDMSGGSLRIERSSLTGNHTGFAGTVTDEGGHLTILDTTVAGSSGEKSAEIEANGASQLDLHGATIAGGSLPGLALLGTTSATVEGSVISGAPAVACNVGSPSVAAGGPNILSGGISGCAASGAAPIEADPLLGAPAQNGLLTVLPLLRGSPALNAGGSACPGDAAEGGVVDERGTGRPLGAGCDLGAYESAADATVTLAATPNPASAGGTVSLTATVAAAGADPLSGVKVVLALPEMANLVTAPAGCSATYVPSAQVECAVGTLAGGASEPLSIKLRPLAPAALGLSAAVRADQADYAPGNDSSALTLPVAAAGVVRPEATLLSRTLRVDRHWNAYARLRCSGAGVPCATTLSLYPVHGRIAGRPSPAAPRLSLSRTTFGAGRTVTVQIHLTKRARRVLHLRRRGRARLVIGTGAAPVRRSAQVVTLVRGR